MNFRLIISPKAEETFDNTVLQIRYQWGDITVKKFEDKVEKSISAIVVNPYIFPIVDDNTQTRRCVVHKNCSMLYKVYNTTVVIICFWDNRQDPLILL